MFTIVVGALCFVAGCVVGAFGLCIYSLIQAAYWMGEGLDSECATW